MIHLLKTAILALILSSCSEGSNVNQIFVDKEQKNTFDQLIDQAVYEYDNKNYTEALASIDQAQSIFPDAEEATVMKAYIYLGLAGIDILTLVRKLSNQTSSTNSGTSLLSTNDASTVLSDLASIIGVTQDDIKLLSVENNQVTVNGSVVQGAPEAGVFQPHPIYFPKAASLARTMPINTLLNINKTIQTICPLVDPSAKLITGESLDSRHSVESCPQNTNPKNFSAHTHFLWSFSHLAESIYFYAVVLYQTPGATAPNLQSRVDTLPNITAITDYINAVTDLAVAVDQIFTTTNEDSMLTAIFNNLKVTALGFANIAGLPDDVKNKITKSVDDLKKKADQITGATSAGTKNAAAIKNNLTKKLGNNLSKKISTKVKEENLSSEQITEVCTAFDKVNTDIKIEGVCD